MSGSPPADAEPERFEPDALADLPPEVVLARLPPGRHGLPRSFVAHHQRLRIVAAMLRVLPRHGYLGVTIAHLTQEAGVSRASFYGQFESKEECFLAAYDLAAEWLCERLEAAVAGEEWPFRVGAGVSAILRLLGANPEVAHLITVEALQTGAVARCRRRDCLDRLAGALREGRPTVTELPAALEDLLVGGAFAHVARYVEDGRAEHLPDLTGELVQYLLIPYLDPAATRRIADEAA